MADILSSPDYHVFTLDELRSHGERMGKENDAVKLEIAPELTPEMETIIGNGLSEYNRSKAGYVDGRDLPVILTQSKTGEILGGLLGRTTLGLLFIDLVYLPDEVRGQGTGTRMLEMAEKEAIARGCSAAVLFTITFQAPEFYKRHGYHELGRVEVAPPGASRVCMTKQLVG